MPDITYVECVICLNAFAMDTYGFGTCPTCGQQYRYVARIMPMLTAQQESALRLHRQAENWEDSKGDN